MTKDHPASSTHGVDGLSAEPPAKDAVGPALVEQHEREGAAPAWRARRWRIEWVTGTPRRRTYA